MSFLSSLASAVSKLVSDDAAAAAADQQFRQTVLDDLSIIRGDVAAIRTGQSAILTEIQRMSDTFDSELTQLTADVNSQKTVIDAASVAFKGLAAKLLAAEGAAKQAGATDAQIAAVAAVRQNLEQDTATLAAAIPANTPAASVNGTEGLATVSGGTGSTATPPATPSQAPAPVPTPGSPGAAPAASGAAGEASAPGSAPDAPGTGTEAPAGTGAAPGATGTSGETPVPTPPGGAAPAAPSGPTTTV